MERVRGYHGRMTTWNFGVRLPEAHEAFLREALPRLQHDARIVGVSAGGSWLTDSLDAYSDLDLVVAVEPADYEAVLLNRVAIAERLGPLLASFTGEHVNEPRLLICLYGPPPLHVDLKFVTLADAATRVEEPAVLWERDGRLRAALREGAARYPDPSLQWIEDRFWVWVHYATTKIGRGELFEAHDVLAALRSMVLGPLALLLRGARPQGVRRIETAAPDLAAALEGTLASHDRASYARALRATVELYRRLRSELQTADLVLRAAAEEASMAYLASEHPDDAG